MCSDFTNAVAAIYCLIQPGEIKTFALYYRLLLENLGKMFNNFESNKLK